MGGCGAEGRGAQPPGGPAGTPGRGPRGQPLPATEPVSRAARFGERSRPSFGAKSTQGVGKIRKVDLLGFKRDLKWTQADDALRSEVAPRKPCDYAVTFKITGA
jgi:hypothetical protein